MIALDDWLRQLGLERYLPAFARNDVNLETIGLLTESDLERLGVSLGHRKLLLRALTEREQTRAGPGGRDGATVRRSSAPPIAAEGERRQLTAVFCDVVNSTEIGARVGPESWRAIIRRYADLCALAVTRFEGYVFQLQGDAVVAYFGYPQAHEDDPERAIRATLQILDSMQELGLPDGSELKARVGISTGLVVVDDIQSRDHNVFGETVNLAARLQAVAEHGTIAISDATRKLAGGVFEYEDRGSQTFKGIAQPTRVWRVVGPNRAESRFAAVIRSELSPFIGREREMAMLHNRWELARQGKGQAVLLSGEPGIGKSRIVHALRDQLGAAVAYELRLQCSPFFTNTAFHPVAEFLEHELHFLHNEPAAVRMDRLEALMVGRYRLSLRDAALVGSMLSLPAEGRYGLLGVTPQRQREETIRAVVDLVEAAARSESSLMLFEDAHWADPTTIQILDLLIERIKGIPLLLLVTHRPGFRAKWAAQGHVTSRPVARLNGVHSAHLALSLAGKELPAALLEQIVARTDGVPLYLEEVTKALIESRGLRDAGDRYEQHGAKDSVTIPATLRDSLTARLDRLAGDKAIAQIGSVVGREFTPEMLCAVAKVPQKELNSALHRLTQSGLVQRHGTPPDVVYGFKHALIQDAAYDSLLTTTRQRLHKTIAGVLEEQFPATAQAKPELLAHHYSEAGTHDKAVPYWLRAGKDAAARSANLEAIAHLARGVDALRSLPHRPEHDQLELQLQTLMGNALMATRGYGASEVGKTFDRARDLCDRLGETPRLFPVLRGLWMFYLVRAELDTARALATQLLQLSEKGQDSAMLLEAHRAAGMTRFFAGDFATARKHLERGVALYDPVTHRDHAYLYQTDPGVACLCYGAASLWILGFPDAALTRLDDGLRLAEKCGHAFTRAFALFFAAMLHQYRREADLARKQADMDIELCKEEGFVLWLAMATIVRGSARFELGHRDEGLTEMRGGLDAYRATGAGLAHTYSTSMLAEACVKAGNNAEAAAALDEALAARTRSGERVFEAELYRLQGELALQSEGPEAAEPYFLRALAVARQQGAKAFELRAAMCLCRALDALGRRDEARRDLAAAYALLTEGFDTRDLQDARVLLESARR